MRHDTASGHHRRGRGAQRWGKRWLATGAAKVGRQRRGAQNCGERWLQSGTRGGSKGEEKGTAGTMDDVAIRGEQASAPRAATSGQAQSEDNGESAVKRRHHEGRPRRPARGSATTPPPLLAVLEDARQVQCRRHCKRTPTPLAAQAAASIPPTQGGVDRPPPHKQAHDPPRHAQRRQQHLDANRGARRYPTPTRRRPPLTPPTLERQNKYNKNGDRSRHKQTPPPPPPSRPRRRTDAP